MRDKSLWRILVFSFCFFEFSLLMTMIWIMLLIHFSGLLFVFVIIYGGMFYYYLLIKVYNETCMCEGETRKLYKAKKKLMKLQAKKQTLKKKKEYLEQRKINDEEMILINCQIHNLELELKGKHTICEQCGAKIYRKACFCSQCGGNVK